MESTTLQDIFKAINDARVSYVINSNKIDKLELTNREIYERGKRLEKLGFINSPLVKKTTSDLKKFSLTNEQISFLTYYEETYNDSMFITVESFEKICDKYGLVYSSVNNYNKTVSEEIINILENSKDLQESDGTLDAYELYDVRNNDDLEKFLLIKGKKKPIFTNEEVMESHLKYRQHSPPNWLFDRPDYSMVFYDELITNGLSLGSFKYKKVISSRGYIAVAPVSCFSNSSYNIFSLKNIKSFFYDIKDPIIVEFCKNDFVRILTLGNEEKKIKTEESIFHSDMN